MKKYYNDYITVYWFPELCAHPGICLRLLPEVFNLNQRPWVNVDAAKPQEIIKVIDQCPSGALRYSLPENSKIDNKICGAGNMDYDKFNPAIVKIKVTGKGPLFVEGPTEIVNSDGEIIRKGSRIALCSCGLSGNHPFCDGSHRKSKDFPGE